MSLRRGKQIAPVMRELRTGQGAYPLRGYRLWEVPGRSGRGKKERGMARQAQIIDILVSSPSDVGDERDFVREAVREWNSLRSGDTGYFLNVLTWEVVCFDWG